MPLPRFMVTSDDVSQGRPDPEGYLRGAGLLGADIRRCLVFEDIEADLQAGRSAGAAVLRIAGPHTAPQEEGALAIGDYLGLYVKCCADGRRLDCAASSPRSCCVRRSWGRFGPWPAARAAGKAGRSIAERAGSTARPRCGAARSWADFAAHSWPRRRLLEQSGGLR